VEERPDERGPGTVLSEVAVGLGAGIAILCSVPEIGLPAVDAGIKPV
jgi:hypothetical protein